jgi:peptidoglycan hydrolase CwlO-like protein
MFIKQAEKKYLFEAIKNLNDAIVNLKQENTCLKNKIVNLQDDVDDRLQEHQSQINFYRKWVYDVEKKFEAPPPKKAKPKAQVAHKRGRGRPLGSKNKK